VDTQNGHNDEEIPSPIEVPATRQALAEVQRLMHPLSVEPSLRERRSSRNSFGTSIPVPRLTKKIRPGMPEAIPSFEIMARKAQDMAQVKVAAAKNMAFAFDIDGVLVHGDRLIPEGKKALEILNGDNELGIKVCGYYHGFITDCC
jgi:hypothetical protein